MHILIGLFLGLIVGTILIIMWASGNLLACVFLSILPSLGLLVIAMRENPALPIYPQICLGALVIIWLPRSLMHISASRSKRRKQVATSELRVEPRYVSEVLRVGWASSDSADMTDPRRRSRR